MGRGRRKQREEGDVVSRGPPPLFPGPASAPRPKDTDGIPQCDDSCLCSVRAYSITKSVQLSSIVCRGGMHYAILGKSRLLSTRARGTHSPSNPPPFSRPPPLSSHPPPPPSGFVDILSLSVPLCRPAETRPSFSRALPSPPLHTRVVYGGRKLGGGRSRGTHFSHFRPNNQIYCIHGMNSSTASSVCTSTVWLSLSLTPSASMALRPRRPSSSSPPRPGPSPWPPWPPRLSSPAPSSPARGAPRTRSRTGQASGTSSQGATAGRRAGGKGRNILLSLVI